MKDFSEAKQARFYKISSFFVRSHFYGSAYLLAQGAGRVQLLAHSVDCLIRGVSTPSLPVMLLPSCSALSAALISKFILSVMYHPSLGQSKEMTQFYEHYLLSTRFLT